MSLKEAYSVILKVDQINSDSGHIRENDATERIRKREICVRECKRNVVGRERANVNLWSDCHFLLEKEILFDGISSWIADEEMPFSLLDEGNLRVLDFDKS